MFNSELFNVIPISFLWAISSNLREKKKYKLSARYQPYHAMTVFVVRRRRYSDGKETYYPLHSSKTRIGLGLDSD
jgi:hypothetical protein